MTLLFLILKIAGMAILSVIGLLVLAVAVTLIVGSVNGAKVHKLNLKKLDDDANSKE